MINKPRIQWSAKRAPTRLAMNFFTQTVDASLWASRTFEDPAYDDDDAACAVGASAVTVDVSDDGAVGAVLVLGVGAAGVAAVEAVWPDGAVMGTVRGEGVREVEVRAGEGLVYACVGEGAVPEGREIAWAGAVSDALRPRAVVIVCGIPQWRYKGDAAEFEELPGSRVRVLSTSAVDAEAVNGLGSVLEAPSFVTGCEAAIVTEAELHGTPATLTVAIVESMRYEAADVERLVAALAAALEVHTGVPLVLGKHVQDRIMVQAKASHISAQNSIYL